MSTLGCMTREHPSKGVIFALRCQPSGDRRQPQDRSSPETEYINAPTTITSRFLTIFFKMNFLRPRCSLKTCLLFSFTYLRMRMQLRVPWHLYGEQRTNGKSQFSLSPRRSPVLNSVIWRQLSLGHRMYHSLSSPPTPTTLTALWNPGAHDEPRKWEPPFKHLLGFSSDAILLPPCFSICSRFPFVF